MPKSNFHLANWYQQPAKVPSQALLDEQSNAQAVLELPGAQPPKIFTIADGVLSPDRAACIVDTEGQAPADDLTTIDTSTLHGGAIVELRSADSSRVVAVKNSTQPGGIQLYGNIDRALRPDSEITLRLESGLWREAVGGITLQAAQASSVSASALDNVTLALDGDGRAKAVPATDSMPGVGRIATQAEFESGKTGANGPAFVTPKMMDALLGLCYRWHPIMLANPRAGFYAPTGGVIANADMVVPRAWAYLQTTEGKTLCVTQAAWDADRASATWGGLQGACAKYVLDATAKTIRLPDLRGCGLEQAGFDSLSVGGGRGDRMQGHGHAYTAGWSSSNWEPTGCAPATTRAAIYTRCNNDCGTNVASIVDPVTVSPYGSIRLATYTSGRSIGVNWCVYLGTAS